MTKRPVSWRDVPVAIVGFGVNNRALAVWLVRRGARVTICDQSPAVREQADQEWRAECDWQVGDGWLANLANFKYIFRTPGIRPDKPEFLTAVAAGAILTSQTELFFDLCPAPIIGITGTKGKGTTASLLADMLTIGRREGGWHTVWLAGNIGRDPFEFIDEVKKDDVVILELSSFQLMGARVHPHIAIVLNITSDHQDYHTSVAEYVAAKSQLLREQTGDDYAIFYAPSQNHQRLIHLTKAKVFEYSRRERVSRGAYLAGRGPARGIYMTGEGEPLVRVSDVKLHGEHNYENVAAAALAAYLLGVSRFSLRQAVRDFQPLPHRLQTIFVSENWVEYVDDVMATTPEAVITALKAFPRRSRHLILGGKAKTSDYGQLPATIAKLCTSVILLGENSAELAKLITTPKPFVATSMEQAVTHAKRQAREGDVVLLAPGAASFDLYPNYKAKGEDFTKRVLDHYLT